MATNLVSARCYLAPVVTKLIELKDHMSRRQWEILHQSPFAHLMGMEPVIQERGMLDVLMQMCDNHIQCFRIGESTLTFRPGDVALMQMYA